jgi:hypothetical protein
MFALVASVELTLARHADRFPNQAALSYQFAGRECRKVAGRGILCFGDSLVKHGLAPRVLEARLGRSAYNLAIPGGRPPSSYYLLRRALEAGARPSAVLVDFSPHVVETDPRDQARGMADLFTLRECLDFCRTARDASFFASMALSKLLYSFKARFEIRENVLMALRGESDAIRPLMPAWWRNWSVNSGSHLIQKYQFFNNESPDGRPYLEMAAANHPINMAYLRRFLRLASSRGVQVYWIVPPFHPRLSGRRERLGLEARYSEFIRAAQSLFPEVIVLDGRRSGYGAALFSDATHLDREGAYALSDGVAEVLRLDLGRSAGARRRVELPAPRERPIEIKLEDDGQSCLALEAAPAVRR